MGKYRKRLQIIADILYIAREGARKTTIMNDANISYKLLNRYLREVLNSGLVEIENNNYILTMKGQMFLNNYKEYSQLCENLKLRLSDVNNEKIVLTKLCTDSNTDQPKVLLTQ